MVSGGLDLESRLRRLRMGAAVLHVGAHPDDEDTGTLVYLSRGLSLRTVYWSATRGEGGQNRLGPEQGEALGIVRTWESLAAREIDGGEVLYGPFYDFGFSRSGEDALDRWGREHLVREIVRAIRTVQPVVVIGRWSGGPEDGHGQHQAVGVATGEAFDAAGDPDRFPELAGSPPWRPAKLYRSVGRDWQPGEDVVHGAPLPEEQAAGALRVNTGVLDPRSGRTYQELAAMAANRHQSQAMAFLPERGDHFFYYRLERGQGGERSFLEGLDPTLPGLADGMGSDRLTKVLGEARGHVDAALEELRNDDRAAAGNEVLQGLDRIREARAALDDEVPDRVERRAVERALDRKIRGFGDAAAACHGITLECRADDARVSEGQRVGVTARLWSPGSAPIEHRSFRIKAPDGWTVTPDVAAGEARSEESATVVEGRFDVGVPDGADPTTPYWLREPRTPNRYGWPPRGPLGQPFDPPIVGAVADLIVGGRPVTLSAPAVRRETFAGGFRELPVSILPAIAVLPRARRVFVPHEGRARTVEAQLTVRCMTAKGATARLRAVVPKGWSVYPESVDLELAVRGDARTARFDVTVPDHAASGLFDVEFVLDSGETRPAVVVDPVRRRAEGLPGPTDEANAAEEVFIIRPAAVSVHVIDARFVQTLSVGYIEGADEEVVPALERFGVDLSVLKEQDLVFGDLARFDSLVVGANAYLTRPDVRKAASRLLEYVEGGGTLIVLYQGYGYQHGGFAPYPFRFHQPHDRVTIPDAPVDILVPDHPIVRVPNRITAADFDGWVHDRGMYFFGEWDQRYTAVLASSDPGDAPKEGGLLMANYGRGTYVYCGYSLHRQIPAGVAGGFRLLANLIGLAEARIQDRRRRAAAVPLFASLSEDQLYAVARLMSERWVDDGQYLCREGERGDELYVLIDGEVEVVKERDRSPQIITVAREGEAIGDLAVVTEHPRSASLRARGTAKVLVLRAEHFRALLRDHADLALDVIRSIAQRLLASEERFRSASPSD
jgi:LmbE family N-acetylglucosaminyl deacetylase